MPKEMIDDVYIARRKENHRTHFYVTDAGKRRRAVYFSLTNAPKDPPDARALRIFEHGDHTHMRLASALFSLGIVCAVEVAIPPNETIHGRADAIVRIDGENRGAASTAAIGKHAQRWSRACPSPIPATLSLLRPPFLTSHRCLRSCCHWQGSRISENPSTGHAAPQSTSQLWSLSIASSRA